MDKYKNERVVIVGLGITGLSCINFFLKHAVIPKVMDTRWFSPLLKYLPNSVPIHLGSLNKSWLFNATLVVVSPGIQLDDSILSSLSNDVSIIGDIELFAREASNPIVAITGSNGKSTVVSMLGEMAFYSGWNVGIGGNIGTPALTLLNSSYQLYILELSSFQLEVTFNLNGLATTILNISENHINRYPYGLKQYRSVKLRIYNNSSICIVNSDDLLTLPLEGYDKRCISFGIKSGDYHLYQSSNKTWLVAKEEILLDCSTMIISGLHNYINALAALALADAIGLPRSASLTAIKKFRGLPHRFELVHERNGVQWINDSKSTNVVSTQTALKRLKTVGILHLLLGGEDKSSDFTTLIPYLQRDKLKLYCFGKSGSKLSSLRPEITQVTHTLKEAMYIISKNVSKGDVVLLSPACSSTDQFINFESRGKLFTYLAKRLG